MAPYTTLGFLKRAVALLLLYVTYVKCFAPEVKCGGRIRETAGSIISPNYPDDYPPNADCVWVIHVPKPFFVIIHSTFFRLENDCNFDQLVIEDYGHTYNSKSGDKQTFCGRMFVYFKSVTNKVRITFKSDFGTNYKGFNLKFYSMDNSFGSGPVDWCNQTRIDGPGFLTSPGYPRQLQFSGDCFYHIKAPIGKRIKLEFLDFDLEENTRCAYNYLQIVDGPDLYCPSIGRYCGNQVLSFIYSSGSDLYLRFSSISGIYTSTGFLAQFSFHTSTVTDHTNQSGSDDYLEKALDCNQIIEEKIVKIQSPGYPESYPANARCVYIIRSPVDETVTLTFHKMVLEDSENCDLDYVKVKDGETAAATVLDKLCRNQNKSYTSSGRSLRLDFVTNDEISYMGFTATYTFSNCPLRCRNGGVCENHRCICPHGFQGRQCDLPVGCNEEPCKNGATCRERKIGYICLCPEGYTGYNCEKLKYVVEIEGKSYVKRLGNIVYTCRLNGKIPDKVFWFRNGDLLQGNVNERIEATDVLYIERVTELDEAQYMCVVYKDSMAYFDTKNLTIEPTCHLQTTQPVNRSVIHSGNVALRCPVIATKGVRFTWQKDGHPLKMNKRRYIYSNSLIFKDVEEVDNGTYKCLAVGPTECSAAAEMSLTVNFKHNPNKVCGKNSITKNSENIEAKIKSGYPAARGSAPWFVLFVRSATSHSFCGGTLVGNKHIVTAAHCIRSFQNFNNHNVHVYVGTQNCSGHGGIRVQMKHWIVHPAFNETTFDSDIAVIFERNSRLHTICPSIVFGEQRSNWRELLQWILRNSSRLWRDSVWL
ncbi:mannan-binding lectin serine protease 1-like isoform X2 [Octopus vulgaris]|uniref:Mannan-binding lectin serine protease 1-like isoform X2 n=1 Tax=Octopus vulgaris TaxID=6645 RepID=A0AA36EYX0_OCTVU|nr:mannan-binding lectin serine protease 1-like isoform X2 [Octopus vulgaris]